MTLPTFLRTLDERLGLSRAFREGRPWMGWVLLATLAIVLLCPPAGILFLLYIVYQVASHGAGEFRHGLSTALIWAFTLLSAIFLVLLRYYWEYGRGTRPTGKSRKWKAAEAGDVNAAFQVAQGYLQVDPPSARAWLLKAAHGGHPGAMVELAGILQAGLGGPKDLTSARHWLLRAKELGESRADALLAQVEAKLADRFSAEA
jgi:hypothetical protein